VPSNSSPRWTKLEHPESICCIMASTPQDNLEDRDTSHSPRSPGPSQCSPIIQVHQRGHRKMSRTPGGSSGSTGQPGPSRSPGSLRTTRTNSRSRRGGSPPWKHLSYDRINNGPRLFGNRSESDEDGHSWGLASNAFKVIGQRQCAEASATTSRTDEFSRVQGVDRPHPKSAKQSNKTPREYNYEKNK
jgi:hypothetical protein